MDKRVNVYVKSKRAWAWLNRKGIKRSFEIERLILDAIENKPRATREKVLTLVEMAKENREQLDEILQNIRDSK